MGEFYATHGSMTTPPDGEFSHLPSDPAALRAIVSGLVVHGDLCELYSFTPDSAALTEMHLRPVQEMLAALYRKSSLPLTVARPVESRLVGSCRSFAVLYASMLRELGVPARVRAGFASYFARGVWDDHWITEYWAAGRWWRADAQLDSVVSSAYQVSVDADDLGLADFLAGSEVWVRYRAGEVDPGLFGFIQRGERNIAGAVVRDLACLVKDEMLPWDYWGWMDSWDLGRSVVVPELIDEIASVVVGGELSLVREVGSRSGVVVPSLSLVRADR